MNRPEPTGLEVAIIAMTGRFPGANSIEELWHNLQAGVESIERFSTADVLAAGVDPALVSNSAYVKAGGALDNIELFDAAFFGYSPREAEILSPQHRLFLEYSHTALETAGYDPQIYPSPIGVYATLSTNDYLLQNLYPNTELIEAVGAAAILAANNVYLSTLISYKLNLTGPSLTVQTACSSSLVAVHLACQGLLSGDCEMALAGGVSIHLPQNSGYLHQPGSIMSADGHCRAFDAQASGTVAGNGVGIVVLKRLAAAIDDGDHVLAVIKGTAINNDGSAKISYTAPSIIGQAAVIRAAQATAEIDADSISYVETHGTATILGDPIEVTALTQAFRHSTDRTGFCAIGSLKTNIGHLDATAGVAGLIKATLALQHQQIPPSLHFTTPNPQIDWSASPFYVNTHLTAWPQTSVPRRAGISSLGVGGTNAHAILEEAPVPLATTPSHPWHLLILSAKNEHALTAMATNLAQYLKQNPDVDLSDVAATLQRGRTAYTHRWMAVCQSLPEAILALQQRVMSVVSPSDRPVVFLLPGQGSQYVNMGKQLYAAEPVVRSTIDRCATILQPHLGLDLRQLLYPTPDSTATAADKLQQTQFSQAAIFTVEYALAKLWQSWGIRPQALIGHSIGEYVAACLAGVFDLPTALALVASRGRLMQSQPPGAMLAVPLSVENIAPYLDGHLSIAAINTPRLCVVAGAIAAVAALEEQLASQGITCRPLRTSHAFHSPTMSSIAEQFAQQVASISLQPPQVPYISNVTGTWITSSAATDPQYWADHLCQTVQFAAGAATLLAQGDQLYLEVGPGDTLSNLLRQQSDLTPSSVINTLRHPHDQRDDLSLALQSLGQLWLAGGRIDWEGYYREQRRQRLSLPTYAFQRQRYWIDPPSKSSRPTGHTELGKAEAAIGTHPAIHQNKVIIREDLPGHRRLVAYVVTHDGQAITSSDMHSYLCSRLPKYTVPEAFVFLAAIPRTPDGQLDRQALPIPDSHSFIVERPLIPITPPADQIEQQITEIWSEVLQVYPISSSDNFFDLGGNSISAMHLMSKIEQEFGHQMPLTSLFQYPTIAQLSSCMRQPSPSNSWSPLVTLQSKGIKPPFFCVPGTGGNPLYFYQLAHYLSQDQPFYALQSFALDGKFTLHQTVEEMATAYIEAIQLQQPQGPYHLGGHSFGGLVAFEMANQLNQQGQQVDLLAIIDAVAPKQHAANVNDANLWKEIEFVLEGLYGHSLELSPEVLNSLESDAQLEYFAKCVQTAQLFPSADFDQLCRILQVHRNDLLMAMAYQPHQLYSQQITCFISSKTENSLGNFHNGDLGWHKFTTKAPIIQSVPGDHFTMLTHPHVEVLATQLGTALEASNIE
jgi:phthiocerol/phenolphthiocerol synthesis type-I polyketide synthase E